MILIFNFRINVLSKVFQVVMFLIFNIVFWGVAINHNFTVRYA